MQRLARPRLDRMDAREAALANHPAAVLPLPDGPDRFNIPRRGIVAAEAGQNPSIIHPRIMPVMAGSLRGINRSLNSLEGNPQSPGKIIPHHELEEMTAFCQEQGIASVGFTDLPRELVFREKAALFPNAIVLTFEMDRARIEKAPSFDTGLVVHETYRDLGHAANKLADWLRERGYAAHATHPLGGMVLLPPLAERAGLGAIGSHGLLITPEHGPRVRLAAVFTSITNLPRPGDNPHEWIRDYCRTCGRCIRTCPTQAIRKKPTEAPHGRLTHVDSETCFPFFLDQYGCSVCVKECPFSLRGYEEIRAEFAGE